MGFAISWLAVSGKEPQQVLDELGFTRTGESEEFPESPLTCASLQGGWFLVFANSFDSPIVSERALSNLSVGCSVVSCQVEEHVMFSSATCHENGARSWHVEHDAQEDIYHLVSDGNVPPAFNDIYASLKKEQDDSGGADADVDYLHDAPVALAKAITSYRHDEDIQDAKTDPFEVLQQLRPTASAKPWRKVW